MSNLSKAAKVTRVMNAVAAGQTTQNSSSVDMRGFYGCQFVAAFGTIDATAVTSCKVQTSSDNSTFNDLTGTSISVAATDDNKLVILDIGHNRERYLRCTIVRGTADAVIDGVIALQYDADSEPVTHDATTVVGSEFHHAPAEGTS